MSKFFVRKSPSKGLGDIMSDPVTKLELLSGIAVFILSKWMLERKAVKPRSKSVKTSQTE